MNRLEKIFYVGIILLSFFISSCSRSLEGELINLNADAARTNNYEQYGDFWKAMYIVDKPKTKDSSGLIAAPLAISSSEIIAATTEGSIIYTLRNRAIWDYKLDSGEVVAAGICADREHNIYAITNLGLLHSFSIAGKQRWVAAIKDTNGEIPLYSDLLAVISGLIIGTNDGNVIKIDYNGKVLWKRLSTFSPTMSFSADENDNVYIPLTQDTFGATDSLICLDKNGKFRWGLAFESVRFDKPAVFSNNTLYIAGIFDSQESRTSKLFAISTNGKILWEKQINIFPRFLSVGSEGDIYFIGYNSSLGENLSGVFSISEKGKINWKKYFEFAVPVPIMITKKEIAFVGTGHETIGIYFLNKKKGNVKKTISLSDAPLLYLLSTVTPESVITFGCTEKFEFVRIDDTPLNKILPW